MLASYRVLFEFIEFWSILQIVAVFIVMLFTKSTILYPNCLVLVGSSNGIENNFTFELK